MENNILKHKKAKIVYILYASMNKTGHTSKIAKLIHDTMISLKQYQQKLLEVQLIDLDESMRSNTFNINDLDDADMMVFGTPTYMGSAYSGMKKFFEISAAKWSEQKWKDKLAAGFTNGSSQAGDKLNTIMQLFIFACQHGMHWVSTGIKNTEIETKQGQKIHLNKSGSYAGLTTQTHKGMLEIEQNDYETTKAFSERLVNALLAKN